MPEFEGIGYSCIRAFFQYVFPFTLFPILMVNVIMFFWLLPVLTIKMLPEAFYTFFLTIALALLFSYLLPLLFFFSVSKADKGGKITGGKEKVLRKGKRKFQILEILLWARFGILRFKLKDLGFCCCLFCFSQLSFVEGILELWHLQTWWHKSQYLTLLTLVS